MELLRRTSEDDVIDAWVRAESSSQRFSSAIEAARRAGATSPREILSLARGWPDTGYLHGFPADVAWWEAALTPAELLEVRYIDWDYWLDVSDGTRLPVHAIEKMGWGAGPGLTPEETDPIILVQDARSDRLVVLEGHSRLTNFVVAKRRLPDVIPCLLGISARMSDWGCY